MAKMFQIRPVIIFLLTDIVEGVTLEIVLKKECSKWLLVSQKGGRFFIKIIKKYSYNRSKIREKSLDLI